MGNILTILKSYTTTGSLDCTDVADGSYTPLRFTKLTRSGKFKDVLSDDFPKLQSAKLYNVIIEDYEVWGDSGASTFNFTPNFKITFSNDPSNSIYDYTYTIAADPFTPPYGDAYLQPGFIELTIKEFYDVTYECQCSTYHNYEVEWSTNCESCTGYAYCKDCNAEVKETLSINYINSFGDDCTTKTGTHPAYFLTEPFRTYYGNVGFPTCGIRHDISSNHSFVEWTDNGDGTETSKCKYCKVTKIRQKETSDEDITVLDLVIAKKLVSNINQSITLATKNTHTDGKNIGVHLNYLDVVKLNNPTNIISGQTLFGIDGKNTGNDPENQSGIVIHDSNGTFIYPFYGNELTQFSVTITETKITFSNNKEHVNNDPNKSESIQACNGAANMINLGPLENNMIYEYRIIYSS